GSLASNGGPTKTIALLAASHAVGAGDPTVCANTGGTAPVAGQDQRGFPRPASACAIGAFEPQPATITATAGTPQQTAVGSAFATNLAATVRDTQTNPLPGWSVSFSAPAQTGASATFTTNPATTNASGVASVIATANPHVGGPYTVT